MNFFMNAIGMQPIDLLPVFVKLFVASLCGGMLGLERTKKRRAAGIRTYSMVCIGSTIVMITGIALTTIFKTGDPTRMAAQVVSGIGFIGAGAILVTGYHEVVGITTAAGLWVTACIGLSIGAGYYSAAIVACVILLGVMYLGGKLQNRVRAHTNQLRVIVFFDNKGGAADFIAEAKKSSIVVNDYEQITSNDDKKTGMMFALSLPDECSQEKAMAQFNMMDNVYFLEKI